MLTVATIEINFHSESVLSPLPSALAGTWDTGPPPRPAEQLPGLEGQEQGAGRSKASFGEDVCEKVFSQWSWHRDEKNFLSKSKIMTKCLKDSGN